MSKQQLIDAIRRYNKSAKQEFLASFDDQALRSYLERLTAVYGGEGRAGECAGQEDTTATVTRPC